MEYTVKKVTKPVALEGIPAGDGWDDAQAAAMRDAVSGEAPQLGTRFRLLYDDEYLYIGYDVEDETILASYTDHDFPLYQEDVVEIFFSPSGSVNYYYEFNFSPNSVVFDAVVLNDDGREGVGRGKLFVPLMKWDCEGLKIAVDKKPDKNWSVTVAIPFKELHLAGNKAPVSGDTWRGNLFRIEYGADEPEYSAWSPTGICDFHTSERFGSLIFE